MASYVTAGGSNAQSDHKSNHKSNHTSNQLAPDFSNTMIFDYQPIEDVLDIILQAKNKDLFDGEKRVLLKNLESFAHGKTVKELHNIRDCAWNQLNCPLVCKVYLRHLLNESITYSSKKEKLEYDFNNGSPIMLTSTMQSDLSALQSFGFESDDCLEALIVLQNVTKNRLEAGVNYLLSASDVKQKEYFKMQCQINRSAKKLQKKSGEQATFDTENKLGQKWKNMDNSELMNEIDRFKQKLNEIKLKKQRLQQQIENEQNEKKLVLYKEFVKGILAEPKLGIEEITQWKKYKEENEINKNQHTNVLHEFGYNEEKLDKIKSYALRESTTPTTGGDMECVVCCEDMKNNAFMITPCNHICLCSQCASTHFAAPHTSQKCPLCCSENIASVEKVYFC